MPGNPTPVDPHTNPLVDPDRVALARKRMPEEQELERLATWFRLLGDPTRAGLLYALVEAGEMCVSDLAATVSTTETSTSHALRWLRASGMVRSRRSGKMVYYSLDDAHVRLLLDLGREHVAHTEDDR